MCKPSLADRTPWETGDETDCSHKRPNTPSRKDLLKLASTGVETWSKREAIGTRCLLRLHRLWEVVRGSIMLNKLRQSSGAPGEESVGLNFGPPSVFQPLLWLLHVAPCQLQINGPLV